MKIENIHSYQFNKLDKYILDKTIISTECELYIIPVKNKWNKYEKLLKKFFRINGEYFSNKLYTINELNDRKDEIDIDTLIFPDELISIDGIIQGFSMPFIRNNVNVLNLLSSNEIDIKTKLNILKEIGIIIDKIARIENFALGDIHEANFIYDLDEKRVKAVDLDSVKIGNNNPPISKFMIFNENLLRYQHKYPYDEETEIHISNNNTMYLSYIYMILNTISEAKSYRMSISEYYDYLQFLVDNKCGKELIDILSYIYFSKDNVSPLNFLDQIPDNVDLTYKQFKKIR